jgi:hypothetical protein
LIFDIFTEKDENLRIETNIDFTEANAIYHKRVSPEHSSLSKAYIVARLLGARGTLEMASEFSSDILFGPMSQIIAANKIANLLRKRGKSQEALAQFTEFMVKDSRAISEAVNNRQHGFKDVLRLVVQAQKFKEWLRKQDETTDLRAEYCSEVSRLEWADKLPSKTVRWLLINAACIAIGGATPLATLTGIGISAADQFLLDKLLKGWRPNQFVDGPLKDFIKNDK